MTGMLHNVHEIQRILFEGDYSFFFDINKKISKNPLGGTSYDTGEIQEDLSRSIVIEMPKKARANERKTHHL